MAAQGLRVLAFAGGRPCTTRRSLTHTDVQEGLVILGLQGMIDPPRAEARAAIEACQEAGIQVKMITGDHALTATAIARKLGLLGERGAPDSQAAVMTGAALAPSSDADLLRASSGRRSLPASPRSRSCAWCRRCRRAATSSP